MLPKNALVKARKAIESQYDGECTVIEYQEYTKPNKSTGHREVTVLKNQPCRLSFSSIKNSDTSDSASELVQLVKVFISPDVVIKAGSKLSISQNGVTTDYKSSGVPAMYSTHQEIILELFKRWA